MVRPPLRTFSCIAIAAIAATLATRLVAQTVVENSSEARFQLDLHVPDAALNAMLPSGFAMNVAAQGPAKDANLRAIFVDRMTINGADGKPVGKGSSRFVYLAAPVKDASGANAQLVIGGLVDDQADAPGPFGNYLYASTHTMQRSTSSSSGPVLDSQDWTFQAASGEHLELHIKYEHGVANRGNPNEGKYYFLEKSFDAADLAAGTGSRHPQERHHEPARSRERVLVQGIRWQLRQAVRWQREAAQLGQRRVAPARGDESVEQVRLTPDSMSLVSDPRPSFRASRTARPASAAPTRSGSSRRTAARSSSPATSRCTAPATRRRCPRD